MNKLLMSIAALAISGPVFAAELTSRELLDALGDSIDRNAFEHGEIVWTARSDEESSRELVAVMMVQAFAPMPKVVQALQSDPALKLGMSLPIAKPADWQAVQAVIKSRVTDEEREKITDKDAADEFNLSTEELAQLRKAASNPEAFAAAWRAALQQRAQLYRAKGTAGLAPYVLADGDRIDAGKQLEDVNASMGALRTRYPAFIDSVMKYPATAPNIVQQHLFAVDEESGRPLFILKHQLVQLTPDHALIAERQYYISHSLDGLQVIILCLPTEKGTLVGMLNQTYTGRVAGFGRAIAHRIGREKMQEKVRPMFAGLKKRFPAPAQ